MSLTAYEREILRDTHDYRDRIKVLEALALEMRDTLRDVSDVLDNYSDVVDGDETSGPWPNAAMSAGEKVDNMLAKAAKELGE